MRCGSGAYKVGNSVVLDENNNVYVAGSFYDNLTIADTTISSVGFNDIFIYKLEDKTIYNNGFEYLRYI